MPIYEIQLQYFYIVFSNSLIINLYFKNNIKFVVVLKFKNYILNFKAF